MTDYTTNPEESVVAVNKTERITKREVKTIVEDKEPIYNLALTREQAELLFALTGSVGGFCFNKPTPNGSTSFYLSLSDNVHYGAFGKRKPIKADLNKLRDVLTSPIYSALDKALRDE